MNRGAARLAVVIGAVGAAALGCGSDPGTAGGSAAGSSGAAVGAPVVRDSAGIEVVEIGPLAAPAIWRLEPLWGVEEIEGAPLFGLGDGFGTEIRTRFLDGDRVGVVESGGGTARVHVLDAATGSRLATVGRRGEGPGEFVAPRGLVATGDGGFAVWDSRLRRITLWDGDLELVGSEPLPDLGVVGLPDIRPADGGMWIWLSSQLGGGEPDESVQRDMGVLAWWSGPTVDTVTRFPGLEYVANGTIMGGPPWGDRSWAASRSEGIWLGDTDEPAVRLFDRDGLVRIVRWEAEARPRTAEDDAAFLALIEEQAPPDAPPEVLETVRGLLVVDRKPYWGRILAGDADRLWVSPTLDMGLPAEVTGPVPEREWIVLGADGMPLAELTTPDGFTPGDVHGDVVVGLERDALGVERVRAFRIVR